MPVCANFKLQRGPHHFLPLRNFSSLQLTGAVPFHSSWLWAESRNRRSPEVGPASPTRGGRCIHYQFSVSNAKPPEAPNTCPWIVDGTVGVQGHCRLRKPATVASLQLPMLTAHPNAMAVNARRRFAQVRSLRLLRSVGSCSRDQPAIVLRAHVEHLLCFKSSNCDVNCTQFYGRTPQQTRSHLRFAAARRQQRRRTTPPTPPPPLAPRDDRAHQGHAVGVVRAWEDYGPKPPLPRHPLSLGFRR